jgi:hypothetical protein
MISSRKRPTSLARMCDESIDVMLDSFCIKMPFLHRLACFR